MKKQAPPFKIHFEDGTSGNFIKVGVPVLQTSILEKLSGMRYGSDDRDFWTMKMLQAIDGKVDEERLQQIICAAESVLIDHYAKQGPSLNFYDVDNDEHVIMMLDQVEAANNYIVRVTQIVHASLCCLDIPGDQLFIYAAFDYPSLLENLKFERDQSAEKEDYEEAVSFRELISFIEEKTQEMSQDEPS